jgi:hypothetical protein
LKSKEKEKIREVEVKVGRKGRLRFGLKGGGEK